MNMPQTVQTLAVCQIILLIATGCSTPSSTGLPPEVNRESVKTFEPYTFVSLSFESEPNATPGIDRAKDSSIHFTFDGTLWYDPSSGYASLDRETWKPLAKLLIQSLQQRIKKTEESEHSQFSYRAVPNVSHNSIDLKAKIERSDTSASRVDLNRKKFIQAFASEKQAVRNKHFHLAAFKGKSGYEFLKNLLQSTSRLEYRVKPYPRTTYHPEESIPEITISQVNTGSSTAWISLRNEPEFKKKSSERFVFYNLVNIKIPHTETEGGGGGTTNFGRRGTGGFTEGSMFPLLNDRMLLPGKKRTWTKRPPIRFASGDYTRTVVRVTMFQTSETKKVPWPARNAPPLTMRYSRTPLDRKLKLFKIPKSFPEDENSKLKFSPSTSTLSSGEKYLKGTIGLQNTGNNPLLAWYFQKGEKTPLWYVILESDNRNVVEAGSLMKNQKNGYYKKLKISLEELRNKGTLYDVLKDTDQFSSIDPGNTLTQNVTLPVSDLSPGTYRIVVGYGELDLDKPKPNSTYLRKHDWFKTAFRKSFHLFSGNIASDPVRVRIE